MSQSFKPILNDTITKLRESSTLAINQKVKQLRAAGEKVIHFGFGQSPFPVPPKIVEALREHAEEKHYLPTLGLPELRETFCRHYRKNHGYEFTSDCVLVGPGSKELIFQTVFVLEGPLIIPAPSWVSYGPQAHIRGKAVHTVLTKKENNYKLQPEELAEACRLLMVNRQKILILNNPNNPTGAAYSDKELAAIAEVCREHGVVIISDEIYSLIQFNEDRCGSLATHYPEGTIVTSGLSKGFSAGGYRLGVLAVPDNMRPVMKALEAMVSETFSAVSAPTQYAAVTAYSDDPAVMDYVHRCTEIHRATGTYLHERFVAMGLGSVRPAGAFYLFPDFNDFIPQLKKKLQIQGSIELCHHLLDQYQIAVLPSTDFYYPDDFLGIRVATVDYDGEAALKAAAKSKNLDASFVEANCPNLKEGADRMEAFLKSLK